ncbi:unnamed protein product [Rhizophagus irregularis]|uniref:Uncharacterized protein n=1 Tax=Rhizophagus irregularis TaxID=588596 RepID=A0A2I1H9H7_9GLOM|nr:hypothetical protein RhiirA4_475031 [Rhizophagus irregularis]CAB4442608.1 unnamed protein product [Rhizophagus irregularis]
MYFSTFLKIIFVISLCFLTLNIEAHYRDKHCHNCHPVTITKTKSKCHTKTQTKTKTKTVTVPASTTKCSKTSTITTITSPITTSTTTITETIGTSTTTVVQCNPNGSPCEVSRPGGCCGFVCTPSSPGSAVGTCSHF